MEQEKDHWDSLGKSFGDIRRKAHAMGREAIALLKPEDREAAKAFRSATLAHLLSLEHMCKHPNRYFDGRIEEIVKKIDVDGVSDAAKAEIVDKFLRKAYSDVTGMLMTNSLGGETTNWINIGVMSDDLSGAIYVRCSDLSDGNTLVRTTEVAYYDDEVLIPAYDSHWFWSSDLYLGARMPASLPFEKPIVDPVNEPGLIEDINRLSVDAAVKDISDALAEAVAAAAEEVTDELSLKKSADADEKLRLQIGLSCQKCLALNRLASFDKQGFDKAGRDNIRLLAENVVAYLVSWQTENDGYQTLRRAVVPFGDKKVRIPATVPGEFANFMARVYDEASLLKALIAYVSDVETRPTPDVVQAADDVARVYPKAKDVAEEVKSGAGLSRLRVWLSDAYAATHPA